MINEGGDKPRPYKKTLGTVGAGFIPARVTLNLVRAESR